MKKRVVGVSIIAGVAFITWHTLTMSEHSVAPVNTPHQHLNSVSAKTVPKTPSSTVPSEPVSLHLPALDATARVTGVGLTKNGEMDAPKDPQEIGWYTYGYLPGSLGNSVFAGHSWHTKGRGVFADLSRLKPGDSIEVTTRTSRQFYSITASKLFDDKHQFTDGIFGASDKAQLNLITCSGTWNSAERRYEDRLVVFSEFIREEVFETAQ